MQHKKLEHWKKCNMKIMQFGQSATKNSVTRKKCNMKKTQCKENATRKNLEWWNMEKSAQ